MSSAAAAGRCDMGHATKPTRRTCRIAPTTTSCDTACLTPGQIRLGGPSQARPPVGLQCVLHTGGPLVGRDNASQAALELGHDIARHEFVAPVQLVTRGPVLRPQEESAEPATGLLETCNTGDRKSTRLNSSHVAISYAVF